jgi:peptidoglycan hydrolase FlgJ
MKRDTLIIVVLLIALLAVGGGVFVYEKYKSRSDFMKAILPDAKRLEDATGIKAAITLTQAGLESGAGSQLAQQYHNLFGIKAGVTWKGPVISLKTTEEVNGLKIAVQPDPKDRANSFRVYATYYDSMLDWASLLARLYPQAYAAGKAGDIKGFSDGLQNGKLGAYATDSSYPAQLAAIYPVAQGIA